MDTFVGGNCNIPFFSIIMPTYNRCFIIDDAINSVINQTYNNYELIIIDDCSTDDTEQLIKSHYKHFLDIGQINYIKMTKKKGTAYCRNFGISVAKYDWLCYLDSDNQLLPNFLNNYVNAIKNDDNKHNCFYSKYLIKSTQTVRSHDFNLNDLKNKNYIDLGTLVHKKELIDEECIFDTNLSRLIDWDFIISLSKKAAIEFMDEISLVYNDSDDYQRITNTENYVAAYTYIVNKHNLPSKTISIIVLSYNHEDYIEKALESILKQYVDCRIEVICSDDNSEDDTHKIIKKYCTKYPYLFRDHSCNTNIGLTNNYLRCIGLAKGDYIAILEGDDYWFNNRKLHLQKQFLENNPEIDMVFSKVKIMNNEEEEKKSFQNILIKKKMTPIDLLNINNINPVINLSSCMFRSSFLKTIPSFLYQYRFSEVTLTFYSAQNKGAVGFIPKELSVYRIHENSSWNGLNSREKAADSYLIRRNLLLFANKKYRKKIKKIMIREYLSSDCIYPLLNSQLFPIDYHIDGISDMDIWKSRFIKKIRNVIKKK